MSRGDRLPPLALPDGADLPAIAVTAIGHRLATGRSALPDPDDLPVELRRWGASFVTLERRGRLLGCIGTLEARRPLGIDVAANGLGAAFRDPRFPSLSVRDYCLMDVEVSVLSPPVPLPVESFEDLRRRLRPGVDGVLVEAPGHRATFLPSVWATLPGVDDFLGHLWRKGGLVPGAWPGGVTVATYSATVHHAAGPRPAPIDARVTTVPLARPSAPTRGGGWRMGT